ncbi:protein dachsous-like [Tubulanus polymorphus]|uniref:protein dachsous-like n=1 Tax=Tubulanus polymorphus TaxID=672921 RepID=UPI003DA40C05
MVQFERLKMEYIIHWTIWTIILLVKHGTAVTLNQDLSISEGLPANSVVGRLLDNPPYILFDNSKSPVSADLDINTDTGEIRTKIILDRETQDVYTFNAISASSNNIAVTVSVSDVNDYAPKFSKDETIISISESAPRGAKHALGSAIDPDFGNFTTQRYAIVSGNTNDAFSLISRRAADGILYVDLIVSGHLDYDDPATRTYNLLLVAYDGGDPPLSGSTRVIVQLSDSNDNQPIFNQSRYSAKVPENATIGTSVVRVFATDQDGGENGRVEYFIDRARSDADQVFAIDKTSGVVRLNKRLDYETKHGYELIVVARDNATQPLETTAIVSIEVDNINEHPPSIDLVFLTDDRNPKLSEKASPGDYVARISVSDPDVPGFIANINVTLDGGDGHFGLTTQNNVVYLMIVSKPLDRERRPFYRLTIIATDAGVPPLTSRESFNLVVSDTNDNAPKFTADTYEASLAEVSPPGSSVVKVTATDSDFGNNSRITYGIVASAYSAWFRIDATTGLVMSASRLDCETVSRPRITVTATDHGSPPLSSNATVIVTIKDVNDNQPVFDQSYYDTTVDESANVDSCILKVSATDPDCGVNAQVTYSLGTGSGFTRPDEFEIDEKSGQICIKRPLDYERTSVYEFQIVASDADNLYTTAMVKISVLDKNDNRPVFYPTSYSVNLNENGVVGAEVALVSASDADSGDFGSVRYAIVGGNADNLFTIGQTSGMKKNYLFRPRLKF